MLNALAINDFFFRLVPEGSAFEYLVLLSQQILFAAEMIRNSQICSTRLATHAFPSTSAEVMRFNGDAWHCSALRDLVSTFPYFCCPRSARRTRDSLLSRIVAPTHKH